MIIGQSLFKLYFATCIHLWCSRAFSLHYFQYFPANNIHSFAKTIHYSKFQKNKPVMNKHHILLESTYKCETKETQQEEADKPKQEQLLVQ